MREISRETAQIGLAKNPHPCFHTQPAIDQPSVLSEAAPSPVPENIIPFGQERSSSQLPGSTMKSDLVEQASEIVPDPLVLINLVSQRVRQLNSGRSPLIPTRPSMGAADIALQEIIEGKIRLVDKPAGV